MASPFLGARPRSAADTLAIVNVKRDVQIPAILRERDDEDDGYAEGKVVNTQFGSFPHSTFIDLPWGSQVRASNVDTGSRGQKKRKRQQKEAVTASSGFVHLLAPTPENWTSSLPHRTQVVYTPDYSYILHRIRARPGTRLIEAGAGSGSFTHASARAVFNNGRGKVWSFEFHEPRYEKLQKEIRDHGLTDTVHITHRDVCQDGFMTEQDLQASAVFLDLPAPWLALAHLTRQPESPLDPDTPVHICSFSPCIEQVQRTVSAMRKHGWVDISMVEIMHKRVDVRRERIGLEGAAQRGYLPMPASVDQAVERLREVERNSAVNVARNSENPNSHDAIMTSLVERKLYKEGRLTHRTEPEVRSHTSYLVFAVLPMEWTAEDEGRAAARWTVNS